MKWFWTILLVTAAVLMAGYAAWRFFVKSEVASAKPVDTTVTAESDGIVEANNEYFTVDLDETGESGVIGGADITQREDGVNINIRVVGNAENKTLYADIREGTCSNIGDLVFHLENVGNGSSNTNLNIDYEALQKQSPLVISLQTKDDDSGEIVSCGEF